MPTFREIVDERLKLYGRREWSGLVAEILWEMAKELDRRYPEPERLVVTLQSCPEPDRGGGDLTEEQHRTLSRAPSGTYTIR